MRKVITSKIWRFSFSCLTRSFSLNCSIKSTFLFRWRRWLKDFRTVPSSIDRILRGTWLLDLLSINNMIPRLFLENGKKNIVKSQVLKLKARNVYIISTNFKEKWSPHFDLLYMFIWYWIQHCIVCQVKHLINTEKKNITQLTAATRINETKQKMGMTNSKLVNNLPVLCREREYLPIYIIKLYKAGPFQRFWFKKSKTSIRLTSLYISTTIKSIKKTFRNQTCRILILYEINIMMQHTRSLSFYISRN